MNEHNKRTWDVQLTGWRATLVVGSIVVLTDTGVIALVWTYLLDASC